jgi:hypothetical protein
MDGEGFSPLPSAPVTGRIRCETDKPRFSVILKNLPTTNAT